MSILIELLAAMVSLAVGGLVSTSATRKVVDLVLRRMRPASEENYAERLARLTEALVKSSEEVDEVLGELQGVAQDRAKAVSTLEAGLAKLEREEEALRHRIESLQNLPLPVAEHFAALTESGERRSAKRDYVLFGAGVMLSTGIAIALKALGLA